MNIANGLVGDRQRIQLDVGYRCRAGNSISKRKEGPKARQNVFKLKAGGWGSSPFLCVCNKDGSVVRLKHQHKLTYPDGKPTTASRNIPLSSFSVVRNAKAGTVPVRP